MGRSRIGGALVAVALLAAVHGAQAQGAVIAFGEEGEGANSLIVSGPDPDAYLVDAGNEYTGVGFISIDYGGGVFGFCSGSLLVGGDHVLSAAHCYVGAVSATAVFRTGPTTFDIIPVSTMNVHPSYVGAAAFDPFDIAVLELSRVADPAVERYRIYGGSNEIGRVGTKVGYGATGVGEEQYSDGFDRVGQNRWEVFGESAFGPGPYAAAPESVLLYDFDNGLPANDVFGFYVGLSDLGLGLAEVASGPGDSGGPTFLDGRVAGVTSFGWSTLQSPPDVDTVFNWSWGEFRGDTRVSSHADWITTFVPAAVPEPGTWALFGGGLLVFAWRLRRRRPDGVCAPRAE